LRLAHTEGGGIEAVLRIGSVDVVVTERRKAFTTVGDFAALQLDPRAYKIVVVKLGYLFPELLEIAPAALMALSPGASDLALERLPYRRIARPMFPLDAEMAWSAAVSGT
jgi:microcystin degradation protein MlrC